MATNMALIVLTAIFILSIEVTRFESLSENITIPEKFAEGLLRGSAHGVMGYFSSNLTSTISVSGKKITGSMKALPSHGQSFKMNGKTKHRLNFKLSTKMNDGSQNQIIYRNTRTSSLNSTRTTQLNYTRTSSFNDTRTSSLNDTRTSSLNDSRTSLLNDSRTSSLNDTRTSLLNDTRTSLLNDSRTSSLNDSRTSLLNDSRTSLLNDSRTSLLNDTRTTSKKDIQTDTTIYSSSTSSDGKNTNMSYRSGQQANRNLVLKTTDHSQETVRSRPGAGSYPKTEVESRSESAFSSLSSNNLANMKHNQSTITPGSGDRGQQCSCQNTTCDCSDRDLTSVPQDLATTVTELLLDDDSIKTLSENSFSRYSLLEKLMMRNNGLMLLEDGSFNGLSHLKHLDLRYNNIYDRAYNMSERIFEPLKSLKILLISNNKVHCQIDPPYPDVFLAHLPSLEVLHIDNYGKDSYGPGYQNMTSLQSLKLFCYCALEFISNTTFMNLGHITTLDVSYCNIFGPGIESGAFSHLKNLLTLDISGSTGLGMEYLPRIMWGLRNSSLQTLRMNSIVNIYTVTRVTSSLVQCLPQNLTTLVARRNNILSIDNDAFSELPKNLKTVDISDNNIVMDPRYIALYKMVNLETLLVNSNSDDCTADYRDDDVHRPWKNGNFSQQQDYVGNIGSDREQAINIDIPGRLERFQLSFKNFDIVYINITNQNNSLEELDLSCSYCPAINLNTFMSFPKLKLLNLQKSSLRMLYSTVTYNSILEILILKSNLLNYYFNSYGLWTWGLPYLLHLDLSYNQLTATPKNMFTGLDNLKYLYLDNNLFSHFDADISHVAHLKLLNLSYTELSHLPNEVQSHIDQLSQVKSVQIKVDMTDCPIQCDCFNLNFLKWMVNSAAFDKNFTGYKCVYLDTSIKYILDGYTETIRVLDRECAKNYPMFLIVLAATSILLCAVVGVIIYRFRWKIRYLYYAAYLKLMDKHRNDNNQEFSYDVFVSYDSEDQKYVTKSLCPELENRGLRLLIHTRDFVAGTYIASNIVTAVAESRKTLVVLTRNLVESTWCNYELQMATMEAVHTGRQVLVFLLKENIPSRDLDVELLRHIRSNTYLPYPSPEDEGHDDIMKRFYDKLAHDLRR